MRVINYHIIELNGERKNVVPDEQKRLWRKTRGFAIQRSSPSSQFGPSSAICSFVNSTVVHNTLWKNTLSVSVEICTINHSFWHYTRHSYAIRVRLNNTRTTYWYRRRLVLQNSIFSTSICIQILGSLLLATIPSNSNFASSPFTLHCFAYRVFICELNFLSHTFIPKGLPGSTSTFTFYSLEHLTNMICNGQFK